MSYPLELFGLADREAITDTIYRVSMGIDTNNKTLSNSVWETPSSSVSFVLNDQVTYGLQAMQDGFFKTVGPMDTTRCVSNIRIDVNSTGASRATANAENQHCQA